MTKLTKQAQHVKRNLKSNKGNFPIVKIKSEQGKKESFDKKESLKSFKVPFSTDYWKNLEVDFKKIKENKRHLKKVAEELKVADKTKPIGAMLENMVANKPAVLAIKDLGFSTKNEYIKFSKAFAPRIFDSLSPTTRKQIFDLNQGRHVPYVVPDTEAN